MRSTFGGLSIGISALFAQQRALDVTGHNISNINTPGYTRQLISHKAAVHTNIGRSGNMNMMQVGTGVSVQSIKQYRDDFLDNKLIRENREFGYWSNRSASFEELEAIFDESSDQGIQSVMNGFWNSWEQLSKPAGNITARALVKESSIAFVETVKNLDHMLNSYRKNKDAEIIESVHKINNIVKKVADLNMQIKKIEANNGSVANDFRDERWKLVNELSTMAKIQVYDSDTINIALEGRLIVDDIFYQEIDIVPDHTMNGFVQLEWKNTQDKLIMTGGGLKALFESRDGLVKGYRDRVDELVRGLAAEVNAIHIQGFGIKDGVSRSLFINAHDGTSSNINLQNIAFNPALNDFDNIATGETPNSIEDNRIALKIANVRSKQFFTNKQYVGNTTDARFNFDEFYRSLVLDLGNEGREAATAADSQRMMVDQIEHRRQAMGAVSIDEEMSNLIRYEHSYNAASRVVNAMDEMLDVIVNKIGLGGR